MSFSRIVSSFLVLSLCLPAASCLQVQTAARPQVDTAALVQTVREYGQNVHLNGAVATPQHAQESATRPILCATTKANIRGRSRPSWSKRTSTNWNAERTRPVRRNLDFQAGFGSYTISIPR